MAERCPLKLTTICPERASQILIAPSAWPTATRSGCAAHCEMQVTALRLSVSFHLESCSPFFTSQQITSSFAPTYALPAPVERALAVLEEDSGAQTQLEDAVQTVPKLTDGSYFLLWLLVTARRM